jgi:intermediate peptidase
MLPRHAISRVAASKGWKSLRNLSTSNPSPAALSVAPIFHRTRTSGSMRASSPHPNSISASPPDTDLRAIFDAPFSNLPSSSAALSPTGLFGDPLLQEPQDFITLAHATIRKAKAIVSRITNAPHVGLGEMKLVVQNFDRLSDLLCGVIDSAELVRHAHPDESWVQYSNEAYEILCSYMNVLNTHTGLYEARSLQCWQP